jgi:hypothetical protein
VLDARSARRLSSARDGIAAVLRGAVERSGAAVVAIDGSADLRFGSMEVRIEAMHAEGDGPATDGLVARFADTGARAARAAVVLTGDLEPGAVVVPSTSLAPAAAMELPNHGAMRPDLVEVVRAVHPDALVEPADRTRAAHDRWQALLGRATRGITARDGALRLEVDADGHARSWHWAGERWVRD